MIKFRRIRLIQIICILVLINCSSTATKRGALSEAVEKSNDNYKEERKVRDTRTYGDEDYHHKKRRNHERLSDVDYDRLYKKFKREVIVETRFRTIDTENRYHQYIVTPAGQSVPPVAIDRKNIRISEYQNKGYFGLRYLLSNHFSESYSNALGFGGIYLNQYGKGKAHEFELNLEFLTTGLESNLYGSVDDIGKVEIGYHNRRYFTPDFTLMGLYLKLGADINLLWWKYSNPIYSDVYDEYHNFDYTEKITHDEIFGFSADMGIGWSLIQLKWIRISMDLTAGGTVYLDETVHSFRNDIISPDAYVKFGIETLIYKP